MGLRKILLITLGVLAFVSQFARIFTSPTHMRGESVLLVTAHPDDETMFFGPTIRHVLQNKNELHFLVLSTGDADGLGDVRKQEMAAVAPLLEANPENVRVIDDERLRDGDPAWDPRVIAGYVAKSIAETGAATVITFDSYGVSGHANHRAVHEGTLLAAREYAKQQLSEEAPQRKFGLLTLYSVPLWRKYLFTLDSIVSRTTRVAGVRYTLISGSIDYSVVRRALTTAHKSQMVWFRYLWTLFSRYMVVNDLIEVDVGLTLRSSPNAPSAASEVIKPQGSNIQTTVVKPPRRTERSEKPVTRHLPTDL